MRKIAALYVTGTMLWAICQAQMAYARFHPSIASMVNFDVSKGLFLVFALPGVLAVRCLGWSPQSPLVTVTSIAFWWAAWMIRKRFTRAAEPAPSSVMLSGPTELNGWDRAARSFYEEDWP